MVTFEIEQAEFNGILAEGRTFENSGTVLKIQRYKNKLKDSQSFFSWLNFDWDFAASTEVRGERILARCKGSRWLGRSREVFSVLALGSIL